MDTLFFSTRMHLAHCVLSFLKACNKFELFEQVREAYNAVLLPEMRPAPPLEKWRMAGFCDHVFCRRALDLYVFACTRTCFLFLLVRGSVVDLSIPSIVEPECPYLYHWFMTTTLAAYFVRPLFPRSTVERDRPTRDPSEGGRRRAYVGRSMRAPRMDSMRSSFAEGLILL